MRNSAAASRWVQTVIVIGYYLITIQPPGGNSRRFGGATRGLCTPVIVYSPTSNLCSRGIYPTAV